MSHQAFRVANLVVSALAAVTSTAALLYGIYMHKRISNLLTKFNKPEN